MTKSELKAAIDADGGFNNTRSPHWRAALDLHNRETKQRLKPGCSSCYKKVYEWLQK